MENTTAVERRPSDLELKKIFFSWRHRNGKTRHTKQAFMIVQSIDKPVASGDRVAFRVTCIWFSSDLKLEKQVFHKGHIKKNQSMIRFTITSGKVLDPNIVLFKDLQDLFNCADGPKFLQVIYYTHSTEPDNPFTGLDARVLEYLAGGV
jgi:hypothetical protein